MDYVEEIKSELSRIQRDARDFADGIVKTASQGVEDRLGKRLDAVERAFARQARGGPGGTETKAGRDTPEHKAFSGYLRRGVEALEPVERKALMVSDDPRGGYLAPSEMVADLVRALSDASPLRQLARVVETGAGEVDWPTLTSGPVAHWTGELETRQETDAAFGAETLRVDELAAYTDVTTRLLDDAQIDIEALLAELFAEAFAAAEAAALVAGNGVKKPRGILSTPGIERVASGNAAGITADSLIALLYAVAGPYARQGTFLMSRKTALEVRSLKDGNGRYMWADAPAGLTVGQPGTLLGRPVEVDANLPDIAAGSLPIAFGDLRRGLTILQKRGRGSVSILRDPYTVATQGKVRFHGRLRTGGGVVQRKALALLEVKVS